MSGGELSGGGKWQELLRRPHSLPLLDHPHVKLRTQAKESSVKLGCDELGLGCLGAGVASWAAVWAAGTAAVCPR